jgi:mono/diheme cytochrome c family protein
MRIVIAVGIVLLGAILVMAQTEHPAPEIAAGKRPDYSELSKAPEKARSRRNPLEGDADAVAAGGKLFERHCTECHGSGGQGGKKAPNLRVQEVQEATPGALFWVLTNGVVRRGMPVWSKLPEAQRWQLVKYLQTLKVDTSKAESSSTSEAK